MFELVFISSFISKKIFSSWKISFWFCCLSNSSKVFFTVFNPSKSSFDLLYLHNYFLSHLLIQFYFFGLKVGRFIKDLKKSFEYCLKAFSFEAIWFKNLLFLYHLIYWNFLNFLFKNSFNMLEDVFLLFIWEFKTSIGITSFIK